MKTLYIVRHGIAEPLDPGVEDDARKLTRKGKDRMKLVALGLANDGIMFDAMLASPKVRAIQTARILEKYCMDGRSAEVTELLRPEAAYDDLVEALNGLEGADSVAIVGHEPFLSSFISYCLSGERSSFVRMKKGGVASLAIDGPVRPGQCTLEWLLEPGQLTRL